MSPTIELGPDEVEDPYERRDEAELADSYLVMLFENYELSTIREVLGDRFEGARTRYRRVIAAQSDEMKRKAQYPFDYEDADSALQDAHEKSVQWKAAEAPEDVDLSKAPRVWASSDDVPEWVRDRVREIIRRGDVVWGGGYERLPPSAEAEVEAILEERLTQPQGWSLSSLLNDLREHYPDHEDEYLLNILRNETSAVLNTAREEAYEERDDDREYVFDWIGPNDWRTTDTCLAIEERVEEEGGAVTLERLQEILYEEAMAHADAEGTPQRVDDWQPHFQCRRTFTRRVRSI